MSSGNPISHFGTWEQERLYVLITLARVMDDQRRHAEALAVQQQTHIARLERDVNQAHEKIRRLETERSTLVIRNWVTSAALGGALAVVFELFRVVFTHR